MLRGHLTGQEPTQPLGVVNLLHEGDFIAQMRREGRLQAQLDLDEAWIYGLVRQESRFSADARSSAGAVGLMQLMPTTARSVAKRFGIPGVDRFSVHAVDTNISLGASHLRQLLDGLENQPVLASAAYNAGMSRAGQLAVAGMLTMRSSHVAGIGRAGPSCASSGVDHQHRHACVG